eukprot:1252697-Prymnesium_polylepis.1
MTLNSPARAFYLSVRWGTFLPPRGLLQWTRLFQMPSPPTSQCSPGILAFLQVTPRLRCSASRESWSSSVMFLATIPDLGCFCGNAWGRPCLSSTWEAAVAAPIFASRFSFVAF